MMKFVIAVDFEGLACVVGEPGKGLRNSRDYPFAQREAVREANAAARALFDGGADQVIVWDNHNGSLNMDYEYLDERVDIAVGVGFPERFPVLDETFSGVLLIGYHSRDNTPGGVIAHSYSSVTYQWIKINGYEMGEIAIDAAIAGAKGVPVILVASDDHGAEEAKQVLPWAETVITKKGLGWNAAVSKHPARVEREIYEATQRALRRIGEMKPLRFATPVQVQIRFKRLEEAERQSRNSPIWKRIDPYTLEGHFEKLSDWL
ncbi:MAG: M55 family metallopeptidase [Armatimonadetes bacterium]|nr:M55 family metallopeptidase [Armatimonadota bacterium]MDW8121455.1 M55 family metallopeptidase [Armatimonadota bacterium]